MGCANCNKTRGEFIKTSYGDLLCEDCWDDYICTEAGLLEYLVAICNGACYIGDFDADFLGEVVKSYKINYDKLDLTEERRLELEKKAKDFGLL